MDFKQLTKANWKVFKAKAVSILFMEYELLKLKNKTRIKFIILN